MCVSMNVCFCEVALIRCDKIGKIQADGLTNRLLRAHQGVPDDGGTPTFAVYSLVNYWDDNFSRLAKRNTFQLHMPFLVLSNFLDTNVQLSLSQSSALRLPASECNCTCLPP